MIEWAIRKFYAKKTNDIEKKAASTSQKIENLLEQLEQKDIELHEKNQELQERNTFLRGILDSQIDLLVHVDCDNKIIFCNNTYKLTFGLTDEEIENGCCIVDLIHPHDIEESRQYWEAIKKPPFRIRHIQRAKTVSGYRWFEWEGWSLFDTYGNRIGMAGSGRDVTERIHAEFEIINLMEEYDTLLNGVPVFIWYVPAINIMGPCNKAFANFFGLENGESLVGKSLESMMTEDQVKVCLEANRTVFEKGIPVITEEWLTRHDGEERLWQITKTPKVDGKVSYAVACGIDITDQKNLENKLNMKSMAMRCMTDSSIDAIIMLNEKGLVSYWNIAAENIFGYTMEEMIGKDLHKLLCTNEKTYHAYTLNFKKFLETGKGDFIGKISKIKTKTKSGKIVDISLSLNSFNIDDKWYSVGVVRKITDSIERHF